jgi:hypothetical protein
MTEQQSNKMIQQLQSISMSLKRIANTLEEVNKDIDCLRHGLVDDPEDGDCIISIPSMLMQILDDM